MLSVGRPHNTSVRTGFSSLIRLTRSDNYIKCIKNHVYPIITLERGFFSKGIGNGYTYYIILYIVLL